MNKEEIIKLFKDNPIKIIKFGDIEVPVEWLKQSTVNINGDDYIRLQQENKQLKEKLKATNKGLMKVLSKRLKWKRRYYKEKYIRKELKKWLEEEIQRNIPNARWKHYNEDGFNDYDMVNASAIKVQPVNITFKEVLGKIKELEEGE